MKERENGIILASEHNNAVARGAVYGPFFRVSGLLFLVVRPKQLTTTRAGVIGTPNNGGRTTHPQLNNDLEFCDGAWMSRPKSSFNRTASIDQQSVIATRFVLKIG
jgi:hypothetical protein